MSEHVSDTGTSGKMKSPSNIEVYYVDNKYGTTNNITNRSTNNLHRYSIKHPTKNELTIKEKT